MTAGHEHPEPLVKGIREHLLAEHGVTKADLREMRSILSPAMAHHQKHEPPPAMHGVSKRVATTIHSYEEFERVFGPRTITGMTTPEQTTTTQWGFTYPDDYERPGMAGRTFKCDDEVHARNRKQDVPNGVIVTREVGLWELAEPELDGYQMMLVVTDLGISDLGRYHHFELPCGHQLEVSQLAHVADGGVMFTKAVHSHMANLHTQIQIVVRQEKS